MPSRFLPLLLLAPAAVADEPAPRLQLLRVTPAFLVGVPSLEEPTPPDPDGGPEWLTLAFGNDNALLDFRPANEAGGYGYTRLFSQVQLFDDSRTVLSFAFQAVTPSGLEYDGLPDTRGPTVVTPALSLYHLLDADGTALQLTLNKPLTVTNPTARSYRRDLQCGLAVHSPLSADGRDALNRFHVSVEALGQLRGEHTARPAGFTWDVLPGLHWCPADNWRISGAVVVPVERTDAPWRFWQVTASLQF